VKPTVARRWWIAAMLGLALGLSAYVWQVRSAAPPPPPSAQTLRVDRIVAQAQVVPIDGIIEVRPLMAGRVLRVLVHPGDRVQANQLLAQIESDLQTAGVTQRRSALAAASARLNLTAEGVRPEERDAMVAAAEAAHQEAELARDRWQRQKQLLAQRFVSEQAVTEAERDLSAALAREAQATERARGARAGGRPQEIEEARAQVASAHAAITEADVALSRTRIVAPIGGVVMSRNVNPGDIIGSDVTAPTLFRIVDPDRLEVRFEVEELLAPRLRAGLPVQFRLPGRGQVVGHGKVTRIAPQVEKRSIGADDARIRADSLVRPAWSDLSTEPGTEPLPVNYRLEAWIELGDKN
jgi:multidrug resistance efflux pump